MPLFRIMQLLSRDRLQHSRLSSFKRHGDFIWSYHSSGGRSVGIVRWRTQTKEFFLAWHETIHSSPEVRPMKMLPRMF
jgi:hypothetical protein